MNDGLDVAGGGAGVEPSSRKKVAQDPPGPGQLDQGVGQLDLGAGAFSGFPEDGKNVGSQDVAADDGEVVLHICVLPLGVGPFSHPE